MLFKLVIRHNIRTTADDFVVGDVRSATRVPYTVGAAPACDCVVESQADTAAAYFTIAAGEARETYTVAPVGKTPVFLNNAPLASTPAPLHSGDEIRVGHLTCKFEKHYRAVGQGRRADAVAILARVLIGFIFFCEVFLVYWLPNQLKTSRVLARDLTRQRTVMLLDALRARTQTEPATAPGEIEAAARRLVTEELNTMAGFVRRNEKDLPLSQWEQLREDLGSLGGMLDRLDAGPLTKPLPPVDVEGGVRALLEKAGEKP